MNSPDKSRITGTCPICRAPVVDGNTYDGVRCQQEGERLYGRTDGEPDDSDVVSLAYQEDERDPIGLGGI